MSDEMVFKRSYSGDFPCSDSEHSWHDHKVATWSYCYIFIKERAYQPH